MYELNYIFNMLGILTYRLPREKQFHHPKYIKDFPKQKRGEEVVYENKRRRITSNSYKRKEEKNWVWRVEQDYILTFMLHI